MAFVGFLAWRKKAALETERAYIERTPIRVRGHIVAEEIRANARVGGVASRS